MVYIEYAGQGVLVFGSKIHFAAFQRVGIGRRNVRIPGVYCTVL